MIGAAQAVIGQGLDHPAFVDDAMGAALDHAQELGAHGFQPGDAAFHIRQLAAGDAVGLGTGLVGTGRE